MSENALLLGCWMVVVALGAIYWATPDRPKMETFCDIDGKNCDWLTQSHMRGTQ